MTFLFLRNWVSTDQSTCVSQMLRASRPDVKTSNYQTEVLVLCRLITTPVPVDSNPALQLLVRFGCILRNNTAFG